MADPNRPVTAYPAANANGHPPPPQPQPPYSNTSYPYAAPPPPNYYNAQQYYPAYQPDPRAARRAIFLRRVLAVVIAVFIIIGTSLFITWLVLRPRLPEIRVDSLSVSNYNLSNNQLTANFQIGITVRNPNSKITLVYNEIDVYVYSKGFRLAETSLAPFTQPKKNETSIQASEAALNTYVDSGLASDMSGQRSRNGKVNFNVRMLMSLRLKAGAWFARRRYLRAFCGDLLVGISSNSTNGSLTGGPGRCDVGV